MTILVFFLALFSLIALLIGLVLLLSKRFRQRAKRVSILSGTIFIVTFVVFLVNVVREGDEDAHRAGFADATDLRKAKEAGIADPAIWRDHKRIAEEAKAKERQVQEEQKRAAEEAKRQAQEEEKRRAELAKAKERQTQEEEKRRTGEVKAKEQQDQEEQKRKAAARREDLLRSPAEENRFIQAVEKARTAYKSGQTDLQRGAARPARARDICAALPSSELRQWIGKIARLTTNSSGEGVLAVEIAKGVKLITMNNSISDSVYGTMIKSGSSLYQQLLEMKTGDFVRFDARLFSSDIDCYTEMSLTMQGSLEEPEFVANFTRVSRVDLPSQ